MHSVTHSMLVDAYLLVNICLPAAQSGCLATATTVGQLYRACTKELCRCVRLLKSCLESLICGM